MLGGSIKLVRLFGIRIGASPSWFLVLFLFIYLLSDYFERVVGSQTSAYLLAVACALLFFGSLVLHELGHALVARRLGIEISGIDLWFFGGVAKMNQDTTSPGAEFKVAAAGPAVTLLVVAACAGLSFALASAGDALDVATFADSARVGPVMAVLGFLGSINALLFAFNLIPAFPLDGGRLARALVWRVTGDRGRATRIAGRMGQGFAVLLAAVGLYLLAFRAEPANGIYLAVLGWFLFQAARGAVASTAFTQRLEGITVADVMETDPVAVPADLAAVEARGEPFLRRFGWIPVVDGDGRLLGSVRAERLDEAIAGDALRAPVRTLLDEGADGRVTTETPVEALLGSERLRRLGVLVAVDGEQRMLGFVTADRLRRAVSAVLTDR
jgi:Zn-dependent protease